MKFRLTALILIIFGIGGSLLFDGGVIGGPTDQFVHAQKDPASVSKQRDDCAQSEAEARGRARLLHEMVHGALQVMHRDFFREDQGLKIPSSSLDDVFAELDRSHGVKVHWLAVNAEPMNVDHKPKTGFEKAAVKALASGNMEFDAVDGDAFQFAGLIRLPSQCLKCHVPRRTSNRERAAGVVITLPLNKQ